MILIEDKYINKSFAIYGMGKSGLATAKNLKSRKIQLVCWDDDKKKRILLKKKHIPFERFWLKKKKIDHIVLSPGINIHSCSIKKFLNKNSSKIITDMDLFYNSEREKFIIAITGTNGKSTTCKILEQIFKRAGFQTQLGGNIGMPVLALQELKNKKKIYIIEISSYQLAYSKNFKSKYAAILNISPDHIERHKSFSNYTKSKMKLFSNFSENFRGYLPAKDDYFKKILSNQQNKKINKKNIFFVNEKKANNIATKSKNIYFKSDCNKENLSFVLKICKEFNISDKIILNVLKKFNGLSHRQELFLKSKKFLFVNDSKATTFHASKFALKNFTSVYWILGGEIKKNDSFDLVNVKKNIVKAYIIGKQCNLFASKIKNKIPFKISKTLKNAIRDVYHDIFKFRKKFGTILLSPAAASFDQFKNFEERGDYFKSIIKNNLKYFKYV